MADGIEIKVIGLNELLVNFEKLKTKAAEKVIRNALRKGAKIERDALAAAAPVRPDLPSKTALPVGALASDIQVSVNKTDIGVFAASIGPGMWTAPQAIMVEYGHRMVTGGRLAKNGKDTKATGKQVGMVKAYPWVRPTFESTADAVSTVICDSIAEEIEKASSNPDNIISEE